jgi:hypothetical protein
LRQPKFRRFRSATLQPWHRLDRWACDLLSPHLRVAHLSVGPDFSRTTSFMTDNTAASTSRPAWVGFLLALGALLCNAVLLLNPPAQRAVPWLSLLLACAALLFVARSLWRAFSSTGGRRTRIVSSILAVISLPLAILSVVLFFHSRAVPASVGAPRVGQKAPDFTLPDTSGQPVALSQLFTAATNQSQGVAPRAVLLIFYRGYW